MGQRCFPVDDSRGQRGAPPALRSLVYKRTFRTKVDNVLQGKWAMKLDVQDERYPFFLLWGSACAAQKQATQFRLALPRFELPSFW